MRREFLKTLLALAFVPSIASAGGHGGETKTEETNFIVPSQITGTIMSGLRPVGIMQADIGIYTTDSAAKARLQAMKPVLIANWRGALQEYINRFYTPGNVPDANILANLLQRAISVQLAGANARVLIQAVIAR